MNMKSRNALIAILGLLALFGSLTLLGLMLGCVLGGGLAPDGAESRGLQGGIEELTESLGLQGERSGNLSGGEPAPETSTRLDGTPGLAIYVLLDADDRPVSGATCRLCARGQLPLEGETNQRGELKLEASAEDRASLIILAEGWGPQAFNVSRAPGRYVLRFEPGSVVSGQVLVNGEEPGECIPLLLFSFRELLSAQEELGLPWARLGLPVNSERLVRTRTDERGLFRFGGLPSDWRGELRLPSAYRLEDQTLAVGSHALNAVTLYHPEEGLVLRVVRRLTLVGRVIDFPKREPAPVPGAIVLPDLKFPAAFKRVPQGEDVADEEGRFTVALPSSSILGGMIRIGPPGREFFREIEVEPAEVEGELDLGDLALCDRSGTQTVSLRIIDETSQPIQGAVAAVDSSSSPSAPTDESGRTILGAVVPGVTVFAVYALGYEATDVALPAELPEELEVVLRKGTLLDIRFQQPGGEVARNVKARLSASQHPYRNEVAPRSYTGYTRTGCSFYRVFFPRDGGVVVRLSALEDGRVVLNDLVSGVPFQLRVEGPFAGVIQEESIAPLKPGEHRVREVVLVRPPSKLYGRVLDEAGNPLPQAVVSIVSVLPDSPRSMSGRLMSGVDEEGRFELTHIYSPTVWFSAQADGYVKFTDEACEVSVEGTFLEVRLRPGKVVKVTIEDESGKRLPASYVLASLSNAVTVSGGSEVVGEEGVYLLRGLPDEEVTITAYIYGVVHTRSHDPSNPECLFTVPVLGGVQVTLLLFDESQIDADWLLCLVPTANTDLAIRYALLHNPDFLGVLPGSYYLVIRHFPKGVEHLDEFLEASSHVHIDVTAGTQAHAEVWQQP